jgi:Flp pilus assembly protein TadG
MTPSPARGRRARARGAHHRDERGQTAVLIIGFVLVIAMTVVVVVDATAAYLRRQALDNLADGAALAATDGIAGEQVYTRGLEERTDVDPVVARALVGDYLASVGAGTRYPGISHAVETDGPRVVVRLRAPLDLPLPLPGVATRTHVAATAAAVVVVSR